MLVLDSGDKIRGNASAANVVDYTLHGLDNNVLKQLADGQLALSIEDLYLADSVDVVATITLVNTDSVARTVNLYLTPSGGTARRLIPKDFSLGIGYSLLYDGAKATVLNPIGGVVASFVAHAPKHTNGTDDIQTATNAQKGLMPSGVKDGYDDAVDKKHTQGSDTTLGTQAENLDMGGHRSTNVGNAVDLHDGATLHDVLNSVGLVMNYWLMPTSLLSNELVISPASAAQEITGAAGETELTTTDTFFKSTVANTPTPFVIKDGVIILIHFEAKVDFTSGTKPTILHAELWRVDSDGSGTPQQIGSDSDDTVELTEDKTLYELHLHASTEKIIVAGSRLWLRIFANTTGSQGNPDVRIYNGDVHGHVTIPVSGSILGRFLLLAGGTITGEVRHIAADSKYNDNYGTVFGTGYDAEIYYNNVNLIINPSAEGSGKVLIGVTGDKDLECANLAVKGLLTTTEAEITLDTNGAIIVTQMRHKVDTFEDDPSDDLVTINGGATVNMIVLRAEADARTVVVKHNTGNIWLQGKADISLDDLEDGILLFWDSTNSKWFDIGGGGAAGTGDVTAAANIDANAIVVGDNGAKGVKGSTSINTLELNDLLLAFKIAVADSLVKFNMVDGVSDAFVDESGVDTEASTGEDYDSGGDYYSPLIGESWSDTLDADMGGLADRTIRQAITAANISISGTKIRVTVESGSEEGITLDNVSIVERDGTTSNGTTTPTEILFGGTSGVVLSANSEEVSDWLTYTLDETKNYLLIADIGTGDDACRRITSGGGVTYLKAATDSYNTQNLDSPDSSDAGHTSLFNKLEIANDMILVSEATEAIIQPDEIRIVIMEEDVDEITINTNFFGDVSRDDGNNWVEVTLEKAVDYASGKQILSGVGNVSGQAADKTCRCRTRSTDNDDYKIHNWGMAWK